MKPLSIEELKNLKVGDWVYIVMPNNDTYYTIIANDEYLDLYNVYDDLMLSYSKYGKTWLAYKNKEQAECKGVLVEFACNIGDIIYIPWAYDETYGIAKYAVKHIDFCGQLATYHTDFENDIEDKYLLYKCDNGDFNTYNFNEIWFIDKEQAEQKLKELRGEV